MYVWLNPNRRDRRSRKFEQVVPFLSKDDIIARKKEAAELEQHEEETRRMLEIREMSAAVDEIKPIIEEYIKTDDGKEEIRAVVTEMRRIKEETAKMKMLQRAHNQELDENLSLDSVTKESTVHDMEKKEKVRSIFEVFDADGSGSMDAEELKELLKELCLPTSDEEVDKMMVEMDDDESGEIDFDEFYAWYTANEKTMKKGQGLAILGMYFGKVIRNNIQGLGDLGEARRVIIAHAEHEAKTKAQHQFRLFRPPNFEALAKSPFADDEDAETAEKRILRFAPVNNLLYAEGYDARKLRLRRLGFNTLLYVPKTHMDDLPVNTRVVVPPSIGDGGTGRRLAQWINGQSVEGLDPREGKRAGARRLMLRSIRSPLAVQWHRTRTVHPTFSMVAPKGSVLVTKGKRRRMVPLMDRPFAAKMLQREDKNIDRLARTDIATYPAGNLMRDTVEPSMFDLLAMLSHDLIEAERQGGGFAFVPVSETSAQVMFQWSGPVKRSCCLVLDGSQPQEMIANNETQSFSFVLNLPAGRYTYRFKVDGSYILSDKPSVDTGPKDKEFDPVNMRNLLIVVPHSSDPNYDAVRKPIKTVSLPMRSLGDDGVWVLKQRLRLNKNVTCLDLPSNSISTDGACALGGLLAERPGMLMRLNLSSNGIGYEGALALALGLQRNHSLTSLELYKNRLGDDGCETLVGGLQGHRALLNLELGGNFIHCDGACALASSLYGNYSLVKVGLNNNSIGPRGVDALCNVLLANHSLVDVDLSHNPNIGVSGACSLGRYLADKDCNIQCLGLSGCCLSGQKEHGAGKGGIRALSIGIARNSSLRRLSLADNNIDNTGARELAVALQENTWLISLDLESNTMDDEWLRPAHTLHTDQDPSIRSIASNVLRNAHIHKVDGEFVPIGTRKWDTEAGVPGMVISSGNRGDQVAARREKRIASELEEERKLKLKGESSEEIVDEATLAEAPYSDGDERNFIANVVGDPLDVVAAALRDRKGMVGAEGKDGVWRLEGRWVPRSTQAPPASLSHGSLGDASSQMETGPRWLSHVAAAAESNERREASLAAAEKLRILDENKYIEEAIARAEEETPYFLHGISCSLEEENGLGKKLVKALAEQVIVKKLKSQAQTRARRREVLSKQSEDKEEVWKSLQEYQKRCLREDVLEVFDSFDSDCSGTVDAEELACAVQSLGLDLEPEELGILMSELDDDGSGSVGFEEFFTWYTGGGMWKLLERGGTARWLAVRMKKAMGVGPRFSPDARAKRLWASVLSYQQQRKARIKFRRDRPPRRGCVCTSTGFAFYDARALQEHNATFDFESFHMRSRKIAARERLCERAREALNAVPLYPCIMCFDAEVPSYIELTGFDIPDQRIGRPIALIRFTDVVRCVEGRGSWLRILQTGFPGGVWVFNEKNRYPEVLIPLVVGKPPGNPCEPGEKVIEVDAHVRPKPQVRGKKPKRLRPVMIWYNDDEFETWFTLEPRLPRGAVLKIRQKPDDDAQIVGGLSQGFAIKAVCSTGDWVMVAYMAPAPKGGVDEEGEVKMVVKEGWMVLLSPLRVLLVPVTDPHALYALEGKESPAELPPTPTFDDGDDSSEEEEVTEEQKKVLRRVAREARKQKKKEDKKKKKAKG